MIFSLFDKIYGNIVRKKYIIFWEKGETNHLSGDQNCDAQMKKSQLSSDQRNANENHNSMRADTDKSGNKVSKRMRSNRNSYRLPVEVHISTTTLKCHSEISSVGEDMHNTYSSHIISRNLPLRNFHRNTGRPL